MNNKRYIFLSLIFLGFCLYSCSNASSNYSPKPKGFQRFELPEHQYQKLENSHPFSFEYSKSAIIQKDSTRNAEPHWLIVYYPELDARIQFTYKPINGDLKKLEAHIGDAFKLASKHQVKAYSQEESVVQLKNGKKAVVIQLEGEVPSHYQFYLTDTSRHFLRAALYLKEPTVNDSLKPIVDYLKVDCRHLLETIKWN